MEDKPEGSSDPRACLCLCLCLPCQCLAGVHPLALLCLVPRAGPDRSYCPTKPKAAGMWPESPGPPDSTFSLPPSWHRSMLLHMCILRASCKYMVSCVREDAVWTRRHRFEDVTQHSIGLDQLEGLRIETCTGTAKRVLDVFWVVDTHMNSRSWSSTILTSLHVILTLLPGSTADSGLWHPPLNLFVPLDHWRSRLTPRSMALAFSPLRGK